MAAARELRDRYLEEINSAPGTGNLLPPAAHGKYDVSSPRKIEAAPSPLNETPLLDASQAPESCGSSTAGDRRAA